MLNRQPQPMARRVRRDSRSDASLKGAKRSHVMGVGVLSAVVVMWLATPFDSDANYTPAGGANLEAKPVFDINSLPAAFSSSLSSFVGLDLASIQAHLPVSAHEPVGVPSNPGNLRSFRVKKGDTLSSIFARAGLPLVQAIAISRQKGASALNRIRLDQTLHFYFNADKQLDSIEYEVDAVTTLVVAVTGKGEYQVAEHKKDVEYREFSAGGTITSSLSEAAEKAGISYSLALALVDIFKWEVDFARDVQEGDEFRILYEKAYINGEFIKNGRILAAEFINGGKRLQAVRFEDDDGELVGYFTPKGDSLRRGFLRTPVSFGRISSGFSKKRFHPIKKTWRAHKGVDYAARKGTPIFAVADGVVQLAGRKNGYGKTVILRHGSKYTTLYAHMNGYAKGIRSGKRVSQGQVIGYVGSTGLATGPHLHYEFRVYGKHKNPLKVKLPKADPIAQKYLATFTAQTSPLLARLNAIEPTRLAKR